MTAAKEAQRLEKIEKGRLAPSEMFKTAEYSAWDDKGIPTLDKEGVAVAKSKSKKLAKEYDVQTKSVPPTCTLSIADVSLQTS
jgi:cysteinyl-tRNA synthetase